jgi:hypothetical protein
MDSPNTAKSPEALAANSARYASNSGSPFLASTPFPSPQLSTFPISYAEASTLFSHTLSSSDPPPPSPSASSPIYISDDSSPEIVVTGSRKLRRPARRIQIHRKRTISTHAMAPTSASPVGSSAPRRQSARVKSLPKPPPAENPAPAAAAASKTKAKPQAVTRSLRPQRSSTGYYEISSDSSDDNNGSGYEQHEGEDSEEEKEGVSQQEPSVEQPERGSAAGKSLRPRKSLVVPAGLEDYVDTNEALSNRKRTTKKKKKQSQAKKKAAGRLPPGKACKFCRETRRRCNREKPRCAECIKANRSCLVPDVDNADDQWEDESADNKEFSVRAEIRKTLEETKRRRDTFYVQYRELFEPLLPEKNYISKLAEKRTLAAAHKDSDASMGGDPNGSVKHKEADENSEDKLEDTKDLSDGQIQAEATESTKFEIEVRNGIKAEDQTANVIGPINYPEAIPYQLLEKQPEQYVKPVPFRFVVLRPCLTHV